MTSYSIRWTSLFVFKFSNGMHYRGCNVLGDHLLASLCPSVSSLHKARWISSFYPLSMGRRSCKIADRKEAQTAKRGKLCTRIGKEVVSCIKRGGGPDPMSNKLLAAVMEKARELEVPKEIVDRNIRRALEKGQEAYIEKLYEVHGFGGVGLVVEVLTDKITRSVAAVRDVVKECGGKMADPGSVVFKFRRAHVIYIKASDVNKYELLAIAIDAGAEDVIEPQDDTYDGGVYTSEDKLEGYYKIVCSTENYSAIFCMLRCVKGVTLEPGNGMELLPLSTIEVDDETVVRNRTLVSKLLELDDVDAVYTDQM